MKTTREGRYNRRQVKDKRKRGASITSHHTVFPTYTSTEITLQGMTGIPGLDLTTTYFK